MSPRAACRLETLGFEHVYDYVPGKVDWLARGLPTEGQQADKKRVGALARRDVITTSLGAPVGELADQVRDSPYGFGLVLAEDGTLLGRVRASKLRDASPSAVAEELLEPGPSTMRPDLTPQEVADRLDKRGFKTAIITTPEGKLIGLVQRNDLE